MKVSRESSVQNNSKKHSSISDRSKAKIDLLFEILNINRLFGKKSLLKDFLFIAITLFVFSYSAAALGLQFFGGLINTEDESVRLSSYGTLAYWPLNFNDMLSGLVTVFTLLLVNNMDVTESGFEATYSDKSHIILCRIAFVLWYLIGVVLLLNILISFIVFEIEAAEEKDIAKNSDFNAKSNITVER
jgi:hypothetical protein